MADLDSTTLTQRIALISVAKLAVDGDTPAHAGEIARCCASYSDTVDADMGGSISEAAATRALNELEDDGLVQVATEGSDSPVGKGRPEYEPELDASTLIEAFDDDERLDGLLDQLD